MNILLAGDSFGAKWPDSLIGWPSLLSKLHTVNNVCEAGIGEYKILRQIKNQNIKKFDLVIVNHTSPYRVHTASPIHNTNLHANCDLIFSDVEALDQNDPKIETAINWFKYHYDEDFQEGIYKLIRKEIKDLITVPYLAIDHNKTSADFGFEDVRLDFSKFWPKNRGNVNHYTIEGNTYVYKTILEKINEMGIRS